MVRRRFVILGSGTGVGKSYAAALLVAGLRERGFRVVGLKPLESGISPETLAMSDAARLAKAGGTKLAHCYAFEQPISPHLAARAVAEEVSLRRIGAWVEEREEEAGAEVSVIEVAGGAFSPVSDTLTNVDLALALELPEVPVDWILVAPDSLGVLHDVTATLLGLSLSRPAPATFSVVLSSAREPDPSSGTNARELTDVVFRRLAGAAPLVREVATITVGSDKCESFVSSVTARLQAG